MTLTVTDIVAKINRTGGKPIDPLRQVVGECWTFNSWHNSAGYPYVRWQGRDQPAHRVIHELLTGECLDGLDRDHICRNVACVNPDHGEAVSHAENMRRLSQAQTRCRKAGHDWTDPHNVRTRPSGARYCAECDRINLRARYAARKAAS